MCECVSGGQQVNSTHVELRGVCMGAGVGMGGDTHIRTAAPPPGPSCAYCYLEVDVRVGAVGM